MADKDKDSVPVHVEDIDVEITKDENQLKKIRSVMGTVKLTEGTIVYVPAPTADPRDPLNARKWQKMTIVVVISIFSTLGLALVTGFGGLLGFYIPSYFADGKDDADITALMTYPTLFMGIGNLIGMPIAYAVGRRSVLLVSSLVLAASASMCAAATSYELQFAARCIMGLAAGQSESLVPLVTQEIFFLHERSHALMLQQAVQIVLTTIWVLFASPIAEAITPEWWYGLGAVLSGVQFLLALFLLPETKYERDMSAFQEAVPDSNDSPLQVCTEKPALDFVNYQPRTLKSDMRLWIGTPDWKKGWETLVQTFELLLYPQVFWAMCLNGLVIGCQVCLGTTYSNIVTAPPYNWPDSSASYVNCGQIVVALIGFPLFGRGSDRLIEWFAKRREGVHEPEIRLIPLILPIIVGTFTAVLYGQAAQNPEQYHSFVYIWVIAAYYFTFVGANIVTITYLLDSYPARAGPLLIIICAFRGIISFGVSYDISAFIEGSGYDGTFGTFGGLTAAMGLLGIPVYIWGKKLRHMTGRFTRGQNN